VESETSHDLVQSCQRRVTITVVSLRIIGFQAQVNLESIEIYHFPMSFFPMKWWPTCYKMVAYKLQNGFQQCFSNFIAGYLYLSFLKALCVLCVSFTLSHFLKSIPILLQGIYFPVFCLPNKWKWPETKMYSDFNLAAF